MLHTKTNGSGGHATNINNPGAIIQTKMRAMYVAYEELRDKMHQLRNNSVAWWEGLPGTKKRLNDIVSIISCYVKKVWDCDDKTK
jgi:hypothetical protein